METSTPRFCDECGAPRAGGAQFCAGCGRRLEAPASTPAVVPPSSALPASAGPPGGRTNQIGLVLGLLLLLGAIAGAAFQFWPARSPTADTRPPTPVAVAPVPAPTLPPPPPQAPTPPAAASPAPVRGADSSEEAALRALGAQPWFQRLKAAMPPGVTLTLQTEADPAQPSIVTVEVRENHAPNSGFDPNVSPLVGRFQWAKNRGDFRYFDPLSGELGPIQVFLDGRGLGGGPSPGGAMRVLGGDFETKAPALPNRDAPVIVTAPDDRTNHVARIIGPDEMGFTLPTVVPPGTKNLKASLRLLHPLSSRLIPFEDGRTPEGIRLRVRLLNKIGNSVIRDAVVRPTGNWRELEFTFYEIPQTVVGLSVEAIWMSGPIYVDDVRISEP